MKKSCPEKLLHSVSFPRETPQRGERGKRASQDGSRLTHSPYRRRHVETSNDVSQPAAKSTSGPLSKEYPYNGFGPEVNIPDQIGDDELTVIESPDPQYTTRRAPAANNEPYCGVDEHEVLSINSEGTTVRQRSWTQYNTVDRMFMQAKAARIINPSRDSALLSARVDGGAELLLAYGDSRDFRILHDVVDTEPGGGSLGSKMSCKVEIWEDLGSEKGGLGPAERYMRSPSIGECRKLHKEAAAGW